MICLRPRSRICKIFEPQAWNKQEIYILFSNHQTHNDWHVTYISTISSLVQVLQKVAVMHALKKHALFEGLLCAFLTNQIIEWDINISWDVTCQASLRFSKGQVEPNIWAYTSFFIWLVNDDSFADITLRVQHRHVINSAVYTNNQGRGLI